MRSSSWIGFAALALGLMAATSSSIAGPCGAFNHLLADCYGAGGGDTDASISWSAELDSGCSDWSVRIERRCLSGAWTTVVSGLSPSASPYIDEDPCCGSVTQYRIRMECSDCSAGDWQYVNSDMCGCVGGGD